MTTADGVVDADAVEIGRRLMRRSPDVTRILDRLVRRKLVARMRGPDDARHSVARITKAGLALLERIDRELDRKVRATMAPVSETEMRQLTRLCDKLVP